MVEPFSCGRHRTGARALTVSFYSSTSAAQNGFRFNRICLQFGIFSVERQHREKAPKYRSKVNLHCSIVEPRISEVSFAAGAIWQ
jgi:hypothetical protein